MYSLLFCYSSYESKKWHCVIEIIVSEILLLNKFLSGKVIWSSIIQLFDSCLNGDTVGESERLRLLL
jgi:hypothetical protein